MSRWICVDDICIPSDENDWEELVAFADAIAEQEPIDIVCCGECKYDGTWKCPWRNTQVPRYPSTNDFCSYGEREGE